MKFKLYFACIVFPFILFLFGNAIPSRQVAITIDDLPFVGSAKNDPGKLNREQNRFFTILSALQKYQVPVTGFVIAGAIDKGQWQWLEQFKQAGFILGNHTYTHLNLNHKSAQIYINDISKADEILAPLMSSPKYFRYPYLAERGRNPKFKMVRDYLAKNDYMIAPVTIDGKDYQFNARFLKMPWQQRRSRLNEVRNRYLKYLESQIILSEHDKDGPSKQILLIHMNTLNSYFIEDILKLFQSRGYQFISLPEALQDPYYKQLTKG